MSRKAPVLASPNQLRKNVAKVALPAIAIVALSSLPVSEAGPIAWAACIAICESIAAAATVATAGAAAGSLMACVTGCAVILPLPFPP